MLVCQFNRSSPGHSVFRERRFENVPHLSLPPAFLLRSTPANPATLTFTSTTAWPLLAAPLASPRLPSAGPWTEHITAVLPMATYEEPELAGLVDICPWKLRISFQRRPSRRIFVKGYVVDVSKGILAVEWPSEYESSNLVLEA